MRRNKISTLIAFIFLIFASTPYDANAQFFKKLSKGLEKVNKTLEKTNKDIDKLTTGNTSEKDSQSTSSNVTETKSSKKTNTESTIDDSRWKKAEPLYNTPYITEDTKFMQLEQGDKFSSVNDGVFAINSRGALSFWKITGEKLFDAEWEYCGKDVSTTSDFPIFSNGVAPARRKTPNAKGQKGICLLYTNGAVKELNPTWDLVSNFADGLAMVRITGTRKDTYFYINVKGEKVYPHLTLYGDKDNAMRPISDGLRAFPASNSSWGYIDATGKVAIQPIKQCSFAGEFSEGYAWVIASDDPTKPASINGKYYLIDKTGKIVFNPDLRNPGKVSPVNNGIFYVYKNGKYNYYDTKFNLLASYEYATPFYDGYAYVSKTGNYGEGVDVVNTRFDKSGNFTSSSFNGVPSLEYQPRFDPLGLGLIEDSDVDNYFIDAKGNIILYNYESKELNIEHFKPFTRSGYARFGVGKWGDDKYCGFLRPDGEIVLVLSYGDIDDARNKPWPPRPVRPFPLPWPTDTVVIVKERPPIGPIVIERTFYNVTVSTEGEGTAKISPTGRFEFGDNATLSVSPAEDWAVASITHDADGMGKVSAGKAFSVTSNVHIKVKFVKKDDDKAPQHTGCFQGAKRLVVNDDDFGSVTYYAQLNSLQTDSNPYGDNTYGFIVAMIDPTKKYVQPDLSCFLFSAPFRISGYQHDLTTGNKWMVLDGGSFSVGGLKMNPNGDAIAGMYFQMIMAINGFSQPSINPRHYRLEMIDHDEETGEFTAGILQTYSPEHGWLDGGDERLRKTTKGFMMTKSDCGIPANYFQGVTFKPSEKRNDVYWYPPVEWYDNDQGTLDGIIESMSETYRTHKSDYDEMFNQ